MRRTFCLAFLLLGCGVSPAITVIHLGAGQKSEPITGDPVKFKRGGQEGYVGMRGGFHVVRGQEDWRAAWAGGAEAAPFPTNLDPSRSMLVLGIAETKETSAIHIDKMVETASMVAVWVRDTHTGEGCTSKLERPPFDAVVTPRIDKPVKFFVTEEREESCGEAPAVTVNCRVNEAPAWAPKVAGQPGDSVDCEMSSASRGKFAITDSALTLSELPAGSTAKLAYSKAPVRGAFSLDVFGTYNVHAEATDDSGRKTTGIAVVEALPQKSRDVIVQLVWTNFDVSDDPDTFPRVKLRALEPGATAKAASKPCSVDEANPGLCEVKTRSAFTYMKLKASAKRLPLEVLYTDERIEKGPRVCVQLYFDGARTGEICDREHRDPDARWGIGTLDMETGKLLDLEAIADAGAPDAAPEAGAGKPAKKK